MAHGKSLTEKPDYGIEVILKEVSEMHYLNSILNSKLHLSSFIHYLKEVFFTLRSDKKRFLLK
jgi:hypothetical protein